MARNIDHSQREIEHVESNIYPYDPRPRYALGGYLTMWLLNTILSRHTLVDRRAMMALGVAHHKLKELLQLLGKETRDGLMSLPGIGGGTADKLLAKRSQAADQGTTLRLVDVMAIEGIGAAKLSKITGELNTKHVIKYATHYMRQFGDKVSNELAIMISICCENFLTLTFRK